MMLPQVVRVVRKWEKPIVWIRNGDKTVWAYCMECLVGTTCTSVRNSNVDVWMKRHLQVCKADWSKYMHLYEPKETDLTFQTTIEQLQQENKELRTQLAQRDEQIAQFLINKVNYQSDVVTKEEEVLYKMDKKCWICNELLDHRRYGDHITEHKKALKPGLWITYNIDEYYRMIREGPIAHSPCGKIGFCAGCKAIFPISESTEHIRKCVVEGQSVTKWWKTGHETTPFRPILPKMEVINRIVGNSEILCLTSPTSSVQTGSTETLYSNEIHYNSFESENAPADSDDEWEIRSAVSCSPMDYWDMENPAIRRIFGVLSDILEQGMKYKEAREEYKEMIKELKPIKDSIGKPYKVLEAFIRDEYTSKDLGNFLSL